MTKSQYTKSKTRIFFGWWVVLAAFSGFFMAVGVATQTFGLFLKQWAGDFGWSRGGISVAKSLNFLASTFIKPLAGRATDRYGPRAIIILGAIILGLGVAMVSQMQTLRQLYVLYLFIGLGYGCLTSVPGSVAIANWFVEKRGRAMGLFTSAPVVGGAVMVPVAQYLIITIGWKGTLIALAFIAWMVVIPLNGFFMRTRPEDKGLLPDGARTQEKFVLAPGSSNLPGGGLTARESAATLNFWLIGIPFFFCYFQIVGVATHLIPYLTDIGITPTMAAAIFASKEVISGLSRVGLGFVAEKIDRRFLIGFAFTLKAIGMVFLILAEGSPRLLYGYIILDGISMGGTVPLMNLLAAECFGRAHYGEILGYLTALFSIGNMMGPVFSGYAFDVTGSYYPAFTTYMVGLAMAAVGVSFIRLPRYVMA